MGGYNSSFSSPQVEQALSAALLQEKSSYNITQDKKQNYASLTEAIAAVSDEKYKVNGLVLTFYTGTEWVSKRYNGADASGFATEDNWVDAGGAAGGTQYLDLSIFSEEIGTLSDEDYQKVVKAYEDGVNMFLLPESDVSLTTIGSITYSDNVYAIITSVSILYGNDINSTHYQIRIDNSKTYVKTLKGVITILSGSGTKALTDNGQYKEFASPVKVVSGSSGTVSQQLSPNTYYEFGECTSLTITLASEISGIRNEYMFEFVSGTTPTMLSIPETVGWMGGEAPTIEANKTYQCSIVNNIAVIGGK